MDKNDTVSEEDIEVALRYLKYNDPNNGTCEQAVAMLQDLQSGFHGIPHHDPDLLLKLKRDLEERKSA